MNRSTYSPIAKVLHWAMALGIFGLVALGSIMSDMEFSPEKLQFFSWHKWAGVSIFALVWVRLVWRWISPPPPYAESMSINMQRLAHAGHIALYTFMLIVPISGWLMSSAKGVQTVWFGVWPIPDLLGRDKALGELLQRVHAQLNTLLMLTLAGHVAAALWHHLVLKDDTLRRMR